jgi:hypothetical protein
MQCDLIHYDIAWMTYLATALVSAYGTGLFLWWMALNKFHTSSVFAYTMLWIFGTFFSAVIALYGRTLVLADPHLFAEFSQTVWWQLRTWVILAVLIALCTHMSVRAVSWARRKGTGVQYGRRTSDSDNRGEG